MGNKAIIGVDFGGTKIMTGAVSPDGDLIGAPVTVPTGGRDNQEAIIERVYYSIDSVIENSKLTHGDILGIGLGVTGPLDIKNGIILECPQLPSLHYYPLRERVMQKYKIPTYMNNDANCLILGESVWGAGQGCDTVLGFTLGTGLGCAMVMNKKLLNGATDSAGEIWTSPYKEGIIEDYVSGAGVSKIYERLAGVKKSAIDVAALAKSGDKQAISVWKEFGEALAFATAWSVNIADPDIIILGGSISNSLDLFEDAMNVFLRKYICPVPAKKTRVVRAQLGDYAGYIGAAALIAQTEHERGGK